MLYFSYHCAPLLWSQWEQFKQNNNANTFFTVIALEIYQSLMSVD